MIPAEPTVPSMTSSSATDRPALLPFSPWPRCCPWLVIVAGVAIGQVLVGFSAWLFLAIGICCLLSGFITGKDSRM